MSNNSTIRFRTCRPTDIPVCAEIESASYPASEAASKSSLQYRQHHAARYFRCAVLANSSAAAKDDVGNDDEDEVDETVIGFICSTKCHAFTHESMSVHDNSGRLLAIHSVVIAEPYRRQGIATRMLQDYIATVSLSSDDNSVDKIVLLAKAHLLPFYINCGFQVMRPSAIVHGDDQWYDLELDLRDDPRCFIVDAFADSANKGNPAAVVLLKKDDNNNNDSKERKEWMQNVAQEFNLSETAFVWPATQQAQNNPIHDQQKEDGEEAKELVESHHYCIRYFTPTVEVPLCGHATLASAAVLYQATANLGNGTIVFHASKDLLRATKANSSGTAISMVFPTKPADELVSESSERLAVESMLYSALNIDRSGILYVGLSKSLGDVLIEVTFTSFMKIGYDSLNIKACTEWDGYTRGVIVCCKAADDTPSSSAPSDKDGDESEPGVDFLSRFFGPKAGIDEDPVTGSAHCVLAPYFCAKLGKQKVAGKQMSRRGGIVECLLADDSSSVKLTGTVVTAVTGQLRI